MDAILSCTGGIFFVAKNWFVYWKYLGSEEGLNLGDLLSVFLRTKFSMAAIHYG